MTAISIYDEKSEVNTPRFRAVADKRQSIGRTAGEALDALNAQLDAGESGSLVIVQQMQSEPFFSKEQYLRMRELLDRREMLDHAEQFELEALAREELVASGKRAEALAQALGR